MNAMTRLLERSKELALLNSISALLHWDQETFLPRKGAAWRAEQLAHLAGLSHRLWGIEEVGVWLSECEEFGYPEGSDEAVNLREWRRAYDRAVKLPTEFVEECAKTEALSQHAWREARAISDFRVFEPHLAKLVSEARRKADFWGYRKSRYDALLDAHEPEATEEDLGVMFERLAPELSRLAAEGISTTSTHPAPPLPPAPYPVKAQQAFNREVAAAFGFEFDAGRIDSTTHPFCTRLGPADCRLTTRYDEGDFFCSFYGVLHETGHGLFEQGLPPEHYGTPLGQAVSLTVHESQSRLWENHIGRSRAFWEFWFPRAVEYFPQLRSSSAEAIWRRANRVERSLIRVEADVVTYDLHIVLRFEIERRLINGQLNVPDVPAYWNERFKSLTGEKVPNDRLGCLQDIHWALGAFGYFPTYTLGNLYAAQLMETAGRDIPGLDTALTAANYAPLLEWLRQRVHRHGMRFTGGELMRRITGSEPQEAAHLAYLQRKVRSLGE